MPETNCKAKTIKVVFKVLVTLPLSHHIAEIKISTTHYALIEKEDGGNSSAMSCLTGGTSYGKLYMKFSSLGVLAEMRIKSGKKLSWERHGGVFEIAWLFQVQGIYVHLLDQVVKKKRQSGF